MPKKQKKTKEEKIAESYFPVDENNLKHTTEKQEKEDIQNRAKITTEKAYTRKGPTEVIEKTKENNYKKKKNSTKNKKVEYSPAKIKLKEKGYELIITEKPQAALKISSALGKATKRDSQGVPYYELTKNGKEIVVACTVGHLLTLKQNIPGSHFPIFDISWVPNYLARKKDFTKKYYNTLSKLAKDAGSLTVATDYDVEGEVIGFNAVRFICGQKDASRMKFSTLTSDELNEAYKNKFSTINWGQAIAGETRHYLDWFYGINLSRALMNAIKSTGKFKIMSIGRVQGPTLNLIVKREKKIQAFESEPYWQVFITIKNSHTLDLKLNKDIFNKEQLQKFEKLKGKLAQAETNKKQQISPPNPPFNLTNLQTESYKFYGITPSRTLRIAQSLYLSGLISYPRTSSQKIPSTINYKEILSKLVKEYHAEHLITKDKPIEGKKSDPAHPSIHPTGQSPTAISEEEKKIYDLIAKRFISLFCDDAIIDHKTISVKIDDSTFSTKGTSVKKKAWMEIYPSKLKEKQLPDVEGNVQITKVKTEEKETQPPKRYSPASIVTELEKRNLGTKATRANIIETLYSRGYVKERSMEATPLGMSLISTLEKYSPVIIDEELTRNLEKETEKITEAKEGFEDKEKKVIEKAKEVIKKISGNFEQSEKEIGKELLQATIKLREQEREANKLNPCPVCGKGILGITYSRKTKRHFVACDAYPDCRNTYSLPPNSLIKKTDKNCNECGFPMLMSIKARRKPWFFCFNPECETNKERIEEYRKRKELGNKSPPS
jgi:DNA topoisomerase-1